MTRNKTKTAPDAPDVAAAPEAAEDTRSADGETPAAAAEPVGACPVESAPAASPDEDLRQELEAIRGKHVRLLADFDNFRKRVARERADTIRHAGEEIVTDLLPVLDHFELALRQAADPEEPLVVGVRMVFDQLVAALGRHGLTAIEAQGVAFQPEEHAAVACQPSDEVAEGMVLLQTRRGYRLRDRVIRPAMVIVSGGKPQATEAPGEGPGGDDADSSAS